VSAAHCGDWLWWQLLQALGVPSATLRSGRGTRMLWSARPSITMKLALGMWQLAHGVPVLPAGWQWWPVLSYLPGAWHCAHTALPSVRNFWVCGSWQSLQVTPWRCILLCSHEPHTKTSSRCWPSGWYRPGASTDGR